jgi:hypothetical protein
MPKHSNLYQIHKILHEKFGENLRTHTKKSEIVFLVRPVRNLGKFFCVCSGIKALGMNTHFHKFCSGIILVRNLGKFLFTPTTLIPVHTYKLHLNFWQCAQSEISVTLVINWGKLMFKPKATIHVHKCQIFVSKFWIILREWPESKHMGVTINFRLISDLDHCVSHTHLQYFPKFGKWIRPIGPSFLHC